MKSSRILAYLVTEDWYFLSHRLPMAQAALRAGYEVHVFTNVNNHGEAIRAAGFHLHPLRWRRGSTNPFDLVTLLYEIRHLYKSVRPDLVHHVALEPTIIGSLAAVGLGLTSVSALAGLGYTFSSTEFKARFFRLVLGGLLRALLNRNGAAVLVQNPDDQTVINALGVARERIFLIPGSGVDTQHLVPLPEPAGEITAAFVGRLLDDKGLRTLVSASELLRRRGQGIRILIAGEPDPANRASIPAKEIEGWRARSDITLLGHVDDIRQVWAAAHIAVLPSRREGLPKSLLEAAACGRAIVASDVPGCREVARAGLNAILVPPNDPLALADALHRLAMDANLRLQFGQAGRRLIEEHFSSDRIGREVVALYDRLLGRSIEVSN